MGSRKPKFAVKQAEPGRRHGAAIVLNLFFIFYLFLAASLPALATSRCVCKAQRIPPECLAECTGFGLEPVKKEAVKKAEARPLFTEAKPAEIIGTILGGLLAFTGSIFFILMLYGGGLWMSALGDENKVERAKNAIFHAVIGLLITGGSYIIVQFIFARFVPAVP